MGFFNGECNSTARLDGQVAVVTGSNTGVGKITALDLYKRGADVILACRNLKKANQAAEDILQQCKTCKDVGTIKVVELNLSSLNSVRKCAKEILDKNDRLNILINNAGVMGCPYGKTEDGFETHFGSNHLGHFVFTLLLLPTILKSCPARIVNLSSIAHFWCSLDFNDLNFERKSYSARKAYQQSKLCNILFTKELASRLRGANINNVTTYSIHPGVVSTELYRYLSDFVPGASWLFEKVAWLFIKTPVQGAQTTLFCAVDERVANETGYYYSDCKRSKPSSQARNSDDARKLWDVSCELAGISDNYFDSCVTNLDVE